MRCNHSGYRGRLGIYEVMPITDGLRRLILEKGSADDMRAYARQEGMRVLRDDGAGEDPGGRDLRGRGAARGGELGHLDARRTQR